MNRGDVYDARLSPSEGSEQAGVRPVIIVSRNAINQNSPVIVVVPLTSAINVDRPYPSNVVIGKGLGGLTVDSVALTGQVRAINITRFIRFRGVLPAEVMREISRALGITLDLR